MLLCHHGCLLRHRETTPKNLIWATLGALLYPLYSRYYKFVNAVMALLLLWCAWKIISV